MTAAQFMATLNATGAHRLPARQVSMQPQPVERRVCDAYRLPDGSIVACDASATKGEPVIDFTLADGVVVPAFKVASTHGSRRCDV